MSGFLKLAVLALGLGLSSLALAGTDCTTLTKSKCGKVKACKWNAANKVCEAKTAQKKKKKAPPKAKPEQEEPEMGEDLEIGGGETESFDF